MTAHPTTLRADALPDLVSDWCGPCEIHDGEDWASAAVLGWGTPGHWPIVYAGSGDHEGVDPKRLRLDLSLPECRAQLRLVLERGLRCPGCGGSGERDGEDAFGVSETVSCPCETGWQRAPVATSHLMPRCEGGSLPDDIAHHAPALLVAHALSVAAGGRGIVGLLSAPSRGTPTVRSLLSPGDTWPGYRVATDAEALAAGYALLDADGTLHLPTDAREGEE